MTDTEAQNLANMVFELDFQNTLQDLTNRRHMRLANVNWIGISPDGDFTMLKEEETSLDFPNCNELGELVPDQSPNPLKKHCFNCRYMKDLKCSILLDAPVYENDSCCKFEN